MSETDFSLPPPTFEFLVFSLKMQAEMRLGLYSMGPEKDAAPDLPAARHAIDLLAMLIEKTRGNLAHDEQRMIENSVTELRFRFVQAMENAKTPPPAEDKTPPADDSSEAAS